MSRGRKRRSQNERAEPGRAILSPPLVETACALLALGVLHPLVGSGFLWGHDTGAHLFRLAEVAQALGQEVLYPRFLPDAYGGLGGPILNFNPVVPYYLPALLMLAGLGPTAALKIGAGIYMLAGGWAMRALARPLVGRCGAAVAGLAFVYLPYRIANLYVRMAFSELAAMVILPLAMAAARKVALEPTGRRIAVAGLCLAGLPIVHFPASVLGMPAVFLYAFFFLRGPGAGRKLGALASVAALSLAISAFSWLPALVEIEGTHYQESTGGYDNYGHHFVGAGQLLSPRWGFGSSMPGAEDQMSFQVGLVHAAALLILIGAALFLVPGARRLALFCGLICGLGAFLMLGISRPIWEMLPVLQNVQFPWRILMLTGVATSLAVGFVSILPVLTGSDRTAGLSRRIAPLRGRRSHRLVLAAAAALAVGASLPYVQSRPGDGGDADFTPEQIRRRYFGELKFQPVEVAVPRFRPQGPRARLIQGGEARIVEERTHFMRIQVDALVPSTLRVHLFNSPGWIASDGSTKLRTKTEPGTGLILVEVPAGRSVVDLTYADTPLRRGAWALSLAGLVLSAGAWVWGRWRARPADSPPPRSD